MFQKDTFPLHWKATTFKKIFITFAKEVMLSPGFVCGFVSLFVCLFVNKITQKLMDGF